MNTNEAAQFVQAIARAYPGRITVSRATVDQWAHDLAGLTVDDANLAWAAHRAVCPHPVTAADVLTHHHTATGDTTRPERNWPRINLPDARTAPDIARAELDRMRAILRGARP